ncbi:MAG: DsbC family protein [Pseudomonadota bacterium]
MEFKTICRLFAVLTASLAFGVAIAAEPDANLAAVQKKISEMFDQVEPENVAQSPVDGLYVIQTGGLVAYVTADGRYLLQGDMIDLDNNINLTANLRDAGIADMMASIPDEEVILFAPEEPLYTVNIFTDVSCPACQSMHNAIDDYMDQGIAVRYFLYPRNGPSAPAWKTMEEVWCASDRASALTAAKNGRKFASTNCDASKVEEHYALGREVGLNATPTMVLDNGTVVRGALPAAQLRQQLDLIAQTQ